jgi:hypothetical protein
MKATLVIPSAHATRTYSLAKPASPSKRGLRVFGATFCRVLNGVRFRDLRDVLGAHIETDDVASVAAWLRLSEKEPGLVRK